MVIDVTKINQMHLFNREKDDHAFMENPEYVGGTWEYALSYPSILLDHMALSVMVLVVLQIDGKKTSKPTTTTNK